MTQVVPNRQSQPTKSPPRTHGTPSGYRNIRVLVTTSLHYRLAGYAGMSHTSLPEFVVRWLTLATPLDPETGVPLRVDNHAEAPGQAQGQDADASPSPRPGPSASPAAKGVAQGPMAYHGPTCGPHEAHRPDAAHPSGVDASPGPDRSSTPSLSESSPTMTPDRSSSGQGGAGALAGGHGND